MFVRTASSDDLESIAVLHRESISELCKGHYSGEQLAEWTAVLRTAAYSAMLSTRVVLVAEQGATLLGFGVLDAEDSLINATYVNPSATRRGVGRRLVAAMEAAASAVGCTQVRLNATLNAVPFYEALGYADLGAATNQLPSGVTLPCVLMKKELAKAS